MALCSGSRGHSLSASAGADTEFSVVFLERLLLSACF